MNSDDDDNADNVDEIKMKQIKNFDFDENIFVNETAAKKNVKEIKKGKGKKHKGMDFMEYAKNNGISINIQYEDTSETNNPKKANKKEYNNTNANTNNEKYKHKQKRDNDLHGFDGSGNNNKCVKGSP